jgi:glycyl-tRNA synthetase alpha chain
MATKERGDEIVRIGLKGMVDETGRVNPARYPLLAAYDLCLKCSHYFNILDARGAISVTERVGVIARVRALAVGIAKAWMDQQYSTGKKPESNEQAPKAGAKQKRGKLAPVG